MRNDPIHAPSLIDTEQAYADADAGVDHMGRRHAATVGAAFREDWPWVLAVAALLVFLIGAMAGVWGR